MTRLLSGQRKQVYTDLIDNDNLIDLGLFFLYNNYHAKTCITTR